MKRIIILLAFAITGCKTASERAATDHEIVIIDGCEYITVDQGIAENRVFSMCHKGNCNNPIHWSEPAIEPEKDEHKAF
jgi:hypothetical protein